MERDREKFTVRFVAGMFRDFSFEYADIISVTYGAEGRRGRAHDSARSRAGRLAAPRAELYSRIESIAAVRAIGRRKTDTRRSHNRAPEVVPDTIHAAASGHPRMPGRSPEGLLANRAMRLLRYDNHAAIDIVLANEVALLTRFPAAHIPVLAADIANSSCHEQLLPRLSCRHGTRYPKNLGIGGVYHQFILVCCK